MAELEVPFWVHAVPGYKPVRRATVAECRKAVAALSARDRLWGDLYFPFFGGHEREDVRAFLRIVDEAEESARELAAFDL
jgi:hypothetical protein